MRCVLLLVVAAGTLTAAPVPKELKQPGDAKALVGLWTASDPNGVRFQFTADGTLQTWSGEARIAHQMWTWEVVDQTATPKRAKITRATGLAKTFDCVYDLTGNTLKFALVMNPEKGPVEKVEQHPSLQFFSLNRQNDGK